MKSPSKRAAAEKRAASTINNNSKRIAALLRVDNPKLSKAEALQRANRLIEEEATRTYWTETEPRERKAKRDEMMKRAGLVPFIECNDNVRSLAFKDGRAVFIGEYGYENISLAKSVVLMRDILEADCGWDLDAMQPWTEAVATALAKLEAGILI